MIEPGANLVSLECNQCNKMTATILFDREEIPEDD